MRKFLLKNIFIAFIAFAIIACHMTMNAQDVHFSQFSFAPLQLNPALTGIFDGKARVSNTYRTQWSGLGNGYKTIHISVDAPLGKEHMKNNYFGIGAMVYQDKAGTAGFRSTIIEGSLAYTTCLDDQNENYVSLGFQAGLNQQSMDLSSATWDSQWNGDIFDPSLYSHESIQLEQFSYLDFNAGLLYYYLPDENNSFNVGASMSHVGSPNVSFFSVTTETPLRRKLTFHSGAEICVDKDITTWIEPRVLFLLQGNQKEILFGGNIKNKVQFKSRYTNYKKEAYFYGGAFYRWDDSFILSARFEFNTLGLGISYDINTSALSNAAGSSNAFEINLSFVSSVKRGSRAKNYNKMPRYF
jgi:type IX secretion system PorP/SprF family membrane protein